MNLSRKIFSAIARRLSQSFAVLMVLQGSAWASATCNTNYSALAMPAFPSTVAVPRDLPVGAQLTPWVSLSTANMVTCTSSGLTYTGITYYYGGISSAGSKTTQTVSYSGTAFNVYQTNVPGVGIAMGGTVTAHGKAGGPYPFPYYYYNNADGTNYNNGGSIIAALVKTGDITPGTMTGGTVAQAYALISSTLAGTLPPASIVGSPISITVNPVAITVLTCQTPDVSISMGTYKPADFPAVGSTTKSISFSPQLLNCPGGTAIPGTSAGLIHSVQYRIDPSNGTVPGFSNVAALGGSPSAGGVGIQLYDSTGAVFEFGVYRTMAGFNSATGGNYSIPMSARYYRTGAVTAGPANSTMTMTVNYQ